MVQWSTPVCSVAGKSIEPSVCPPGVVQCWSVTPGATGAIVGDAAAQPRRHREEHDSDGRDPGEAEAPPAAEGTDGVDGARWQRHELSSSYSAQDEVSPSSPLGLRESLSLGPGQRMVSNGRICAHVVHKADPPV